MIAEAIDTATAIGWAIVAWIVLTAIAATLALYTLAVTVWTVGRTVWRVGRAVRKPQTPVSRPESPSCGTRDAGDAPDAPQAHTAPSWARTDHHDRQEAA